MIRIARKMAACALVAGVFLACSPAAVACAACFGRSDSALAKGLNWGIFALMVCIVSVLAAIAACFICLARRMSAYAADGESLAASSSSPVEFNSGVS